MLKVVVLFIVHIVLIPVVVSSDEHLLDFNAFNASQWTAISKVADCGRNEFRPQSCNTANAANLRVLHGKLALTAVRQKYFGSDYTTASIRSRLIGFNLYRHTSFQSFVFLKFRASLPTTKRLIPKITFVLRNNDAGKTPSFETEFFSFGELNSSKYDLAGHFNDYQVVIENRTTSVTINGDEQAVTNFTLPAHLPVEFFIFSEVIFSLEVNITEKYEWSDRYDTFEDYLHRHNVWEISYDKCSSFIIDYFLYDHFSPKRNEVRIRPFPTLQVPIADNETAATLCWRIKDSPGNEVIKFVPNQNYKTIIKNYEFKNNSLDETAFNYSCADCDIRRRVDDFTYLIEQGDFRNDTLILGLHQNSADDFTRVQTKSGFKNVRLEVRARKLNPSTYHVPITIFMDNFPEGNNTNITEQGYLSIAHLQSNSDIYSDLKVTKNDSDTIKGKLEVTRYVDYQFKFEEFHTYGVELNEDYIITYLDDNIIMQVNRKMDQAGYEYPHDDAVHLPFDHYFSLVIILSERKSKQKPLNLKGPWMEIEHIRVYGDGFQNIKYYDQVEQESGTTKPTNLAFVIGLSLGIVLFSFLIVGLGATLVVLRRTRQKLKQKDLGDDGMYDEYDYDYAVNQYEDVKYGDLNDQGNGAGYSDMRTANQYTEIIHIPSGDYIVMNEIVNDRDRMTVINNTKNRYTQMKLVELSIEPYV